MIIFGCTPLGIICAVFGLENPHIRIKYVRASRSAARSAKGTGNWLTRLLDFMLLYKTRCCLSASEAVAWFTVSECMSYRGAFLPFWIASWNLRFLLQIVAGEWCKPTILSWDPTPTFPRNLRPSHSSPRQRCSSQPPPSLSSHRCSNAGSYPHRCSLLEWKIVLHIRL